MAEKYEVIIVGGGIAGSAAAYTLAKAGIKVLVIERGEYSGAKNMSGGRIYTHSLEKLIPDFRKDAPLERKITNEKVTMMSGKGEVTLDYRNNCGSPDEESYSVLRSRFDPWIAQKATDAGAEYVYGIRVDDLIYNRGNVCGIIATGEELRAGAVILADGVNSFLAQKAGLHQALDTDEIAVGVKEVIELGEEEINRRFNLGPEEGTAWLSAGDCTGGAVGGGFIYTNRTSVSIGIVVTLSKVKNSPYSVSEMLEHFKNKSGVRNLIEGGKSVEYSAHLVPEGGFNSMPKLFSSGVLLVGDAAGMVINLGLMVRGMDFAVESGRIAAETLIEANGNYTYSGVCRYEERLKQSFVYKDMKLYRNVPGLLSEDRIFMRYPEMITDIIDSIFKVDGSKNYPMILKIIPPIVKAGIPGIMQDIVKAVISL